jgi:peptide/nickel transport system permease protein
VSQGRVKSSENTTLVNEIAEGGQARPATVSRLAIAHSLLRDRVTFFAIAFLTLLVVAAVGAEFVAPHDPYEQNLRMRNLPPFTASAEENGFPHVLGTDPLGRDVLSRLIYGARVSLLVGFSAMILSGILGTFLGILAGYHRGWVDDLIMRVVDVQMSFPFLLLALLVLFVLGPGFVNVILILALVRWMVFGRVARGMTLAYRETAFVDAARITGCSDARIIRRHLLPNLSSPLLILATLEVGALILGEAALSFLGFGIQPPSPSWGLMIASGRQYIASAWWLVTFPGLAILLTALSLNLLASSLRSVTDPVQRERWLTYTTGRAKKPVAKLSAPIGPTGDQPSVDGEHVLEVADLRVEFQTPVGVINAVNGISYTFDEGETLAILGESGAGKSVSAEALMGIIDSPPGQVSGSIYYRGTDLSQISEPERRKIRGERIAMIFQEPLAALDPGFSVGYQISETLRVRRGVPSQQATEKAIELMERVHIPAARERAGNYPHQFSGGMAQRVMIAMALALDPDILIADEPTTALDVTIQAQIMKLLAELQTETGMGLILITHNLGIVADVADRVAVMYAGRIVETGPILDLYEQPAHPYTMGLMSSIPRIDQKGERLQPIPGAPPDPADIPPGCAFHPRCWLSRKECRAEVPPLSEVSASRRSACLFFKEVLREH